MNNCNLDRIKLSNEIEKIIIFFQNKKITEKLLESYLMTKDK